MQLQQHIFFLLINAFTKQTPLGVVADGAPIPARWWSLSPLKNMVCTSSIPYLCLTSALWSLPYLRKEDLFITLIGLNQYF